MHFCQNPRFMSRLWTFAFAWAGFIIICGIGILVDNDPTLWTWLFPWQKGYWRESPLDWLIWGPLLITLSFLLLCWLVFSLNPRMVAINQTAGIRESVEGRSDFKRKFYMVIVTLVVILAGWVVWTWLDYGFDHPEKSYFFCMGVQLFLIWHRGQIFIIGLTPLCLLFCWKILVWIGLKYVPNLLAESERFQADFYESEMLDLYEQQKTADARLAELRQLRADHFKKVADLEQKEKDFQEKKRKLDNLGKALQMAKTKLLEMERALRDRAAGLDRRERDFQARIEDLERQKQDYQAAVADLLDSQGDLDRLEKDYYGRITDLQRWEQDYQTRIADLAEKERAFQIKVVEFAGNKQASLFQQRPATLGQAEQEADRLLERARQEAQDIRDQAEQEAGKIKEQAKKEVQTEMEKIQGGGSGQNLDILGDIQARIAKLEKWKVDLQTWEARIEDSQARLNKFWAWVGAKAKAMNINSIEWREALNVWKAELAGAEQAARKIKAQAGGDSGELDGEVYEAPECKVLSDSDIALIKAITKPEVDVIIARAEAEAAKIRARAIEDRAEQEAQKIKAQARREADEILLRAKQEAGETDIQAPYITPEAVEHDIQPLANGDILCQELQQSEQQQKVIEALETATAPLTPSEIASLTDISIPYVKKVLPLLIKKGLIEKVGHGKYQIPPRK